MCTYAVEDVSVFVVRILLHFSVGEDEILCGQAGTYRDLEGVLVVALQDASLYNIAEQLTKQPTVDRSREINTA